MKQLINRTQNARFKGTLKHLSRIALNQLGGGTVNNHHILTECGLLTLIYMAVGLYDTHSLNCFFSYSSYVQK